ncbi:MAG: type II toxin-antitoxin system PemK/MazF family toxin [Gammaproteobacteria bacterium]
MRRGEVWIANLNPSRGTEVGKIRPVLIVQADEFIQAGMPVIIVLPLTTQIRAGVEKFRIAVPARDRLLQPSQVIVDQPRALARTRIGDGPLTRLTPDEMAGVERSLLGILGMLK